METNEQAGKSCIECGNGIPTVAQKCAHCGSYQNWRRHIPSGQATLALLIALVALGGHFVGAGRFAASSWDVLFGTTTDDIGATIAEFDQNGALVVLVNRSSASISINEFRCFLHLPIDPAHTLYQALTGEISEGERRQFALADTVGMFMATYEVSPPLLVAPAEVLMVEASLNHLSPPRTTVAMTEAEPTEVANSLCVFMGFNDHSEAVAGATSLELLHVIRFDVLDALQIADFSAEQEVQREELRATVVEARAASQVRRVEETGPAATE